MQTFLIKPIGNKLQEQLQLKINNKTKPLGALGDLEKIALKMGMIQNTLEPKLKKPTIIVFAGDHGLANEGVSAYPQEVTYQMVMNFLKNGAAINVFRKQHQIELLIVDAGVNYDFSKQKDLIDAKIAKGTKSSLHGPAMTKGQIEQAVLAGSKLCEKIYFQGSNIIGFGEMGIGNTSAASLIMSKICDIPIKECVGRGTGLNNKGLEAKVDILKKACSMHEVNKPLEILRTFGGFEMAMMFGAMMKAAEIGMTIMVDGFIATSVFLVSHAMNPDIKDYAIFCHQSDEQGHKKMLQFLDVTPLLNLGMRLGEGTGCAMAYPIIKSAILFLEQMASFDAAGVSQEK